MNDEDIRMECLRLAVGYQSLPVMVGEKIPAVALAEQFYDFVRNRQQGVGA
jgi:hypothetical protein